MRSVNWSSRTNCAGTGLLADVRPLAGVTLVMSPRIRSGRTERARISFAVADSDACRTAHILRLHQSRQGARYRLIWYDARPLLR
jgi:hypothetical protein